MIKALHDRAVYQIGIADRPGAHARTVSRTLERGGSPSRTRVREEYGKLRPYVARVQRAAKPLRFAAAEPAERLSESRQVCS